MARGAWRRILNLNLGRIVFAARFGLICQINHFGLTSQINHVGHVYYMYTLIFCLGCLRFRWVGGRCAQVSPLTLG
eukprot:SAG22_NODE_9783_length_569_cov_2.065957_1_plen_75_part_10